MALARFTLTATVTLPPGTFVPDVSVDGPPGNFGTGSNTPAAGHWGSGNSGGTVAGDSGVTFIAGTTIYADSSGSGGAGALYTAIGSGNLAAYRDGIDNVGHAALGN